MPITNATPGYVDNARLREAFLAGSLTAGKLAGAVGITRKATTKRRLASGEVKTYSYRVGDGTAALRDLGLVPNTHGGRRGTGAPRKVINAGKALRYAVVLHVDPVALGL